MVRFLARATKCEVILRAAYLLLQQESLRLYGKILSGKKCEVRIMCPETQLASKALSVLDRTSLEQQRGRQQHARGSQDTQIYSSSTSTEQA